MDISGYARKFPSGVRGVVTMDWDWWTVGVNGQREWVNLISEYDSPMRFAIFWHTNDVTVTFPDQDLIPGFRK
jgi:hypothetical protein